MTSEHCGGFRFWPYSLLVALNLARKEISVVQRTFSVCDGVLKCFRLLRSIIIINI